MGLVAFVIDLIALEMRIVAFTNDLVAFIRTTLKIKKIKKYFNVLQ